MKKISLFVSLFFVSLFSLPVLSQEHFEHKPLGKILAHRGASCMAPENTLLAFKLAIQTGSHGAECDVHRTSDGVLVLFHDRTTKRTLGRDGDITGQTFEEIAKLDAGRWKGRHFAGEKVPTLEDYLLLMKGSGCTPAIELKQEGIEKDVVEAIRKADMVDEAVVLAFRREALEIIRKLEPKIGLILNFSKKIEGPPEDHARKLYEEIMAAVGPAGIKTVSINYKILSRELIELLHKDKTEVSCWVVNDIPLINKMLDMGVDTVCSDRPELVAEVLKFRAGIQ